MNENHFAMNFGEEVKFILEEWGWPIQDFAEWIGRSRSTVQRWLKNEMIPNDNLIILISTIYRDMKNGDCWNGKEYDWKD